MAHFRNLLLALGLILAAITTSGCAKALNPYNETFNCQAAADDGRCLDTPTAYHEAIANDDDGFDAPVTANSNGTPNAQQAKQLSPRQEAQAIRYRLLTDLLREPQTPLLEPPRVLRVLLLPYRGQDGELFLARHVFIKVDEASWVLTDLVER